MVDIVRLHPAHADGRGAITNVFEDHLGHVALVTSTADAIRGNHLHPAETERLYVLSGSGTLHWCEGLDATSRQEAPFSAGDLICVPAGLGHALTFTAETTLLELREVRRVDAQPQQRIDVLALPLG